MSIPVVPRSQFNGDVFISTFHQVHGLGKPPSIRLDPSHPFQQLWHSHLRHLRQSGGLFEGVIDCLAAILLGDPLWKETMPTSVSQTRSEVRLLLIRTPPNIIVLSTLDDYACHFRCPALWNYVCVSSSYVKLWMEAKKPKRTAGLTALLVTSIDHELAHWAQSVKNGLCNFQPSNSILGLTSTSDLGDDDDDDEEPALPGPYVKDADRVTNLTDNTLLSDTQKTFQAPWISEPIGEAGDYLEISTRGGIMEYDLLHQRVYLVTGEDKFQVPRRAYLDLYEQNEGPSTALIYSPTSWDSTSPLAIKTKDAQDRFPFHGVDGCLPNRRLHGRNRYHAATKILKL